MPATEWLDADSYTEWDTENNASPDNYFVGAIGLIGGASGIIWDEGQDSIIYPPFPKAIRPPNDPPPDPPRVKRPKVPPPYYP